MSSEPSPSRVVGFGAGGHAKMVIEALRSGRADAVDIVALLDPDSQLWGRTVFGIPVDGGDDVLAQLLGQGVTGFFVGVGMVGDHRTRQRLYEFGLAHGLDAVSAIHVSALISPSATLGSGVTVLPGAIVNASARLGVNVIINSGAIVEHDCEIGDHSHVATGARLSGKVRVGAGAHIGIGASVRQGVTIGAAAVVGGGAAVIADVPPGSRVAGVPARPIRAHSTAR